MAKSYTTETIPPEFLSKLDEEFISELIADWHWESDRIIESFSFSIEVSWENNKYQQDIIGRLDDRPADQECQIEQLEIDLQQAHATIKELTEYSDKQFEKTLGRSLPAEDLRPRTEPVATSLEQRMDALEATLRDNSEQIDFLTSDVEVLWRKKDC